jgi:hypothetical protein
MVQPFSDFDLVLVDKLKNEKEYKDYFIRSKNTKFLDNSVNEKAEPYSLQDMIDFSNEIKANYIVSPDWVGDSEKTIAEYKNCLKALKRSQVVAVAQGSTFEEAIGCIENYEPGWLAIPYDICSKKTDKPELMALRRALLVSNISTEKFYIHLLGFNSLSEFLWYTSKPRVVSIDTGVPVMLGLKGKDILDPLESKETPTLNEMEGIKLDQKGWTAICRNIALLRKYLV